MALDNVITSLVLDVIDHDQTQGVVKAIALDSKTRYVKATLVQHGLDYPVDESATVTLTILRPDNVGVQITGSVVDVDNADRTGTINGVYAELTQAALAKSGNLKAQFKITSGEQILRTEIFQIKNGIALDGETADWAGDLDGHNLDEMADSIEALETSVGTLQTDVATVKEEFNDLYNTAYVTDSASGGVAHFVDGADDVPLKSLKVNIEPFQSGAGDPSPDNIRPIRGWDSVKVMRAKKNLWNPSDVFTGFINNNTHTIQSNSACKICYICATPNTTYTISKMAGARFAVACSDVEPALNAPVYGEILNYNATSITITTTNSTKYLLAWCYLDGTDTVTEAEMLASVQIELGSSATEHEPYDGNTYDISLASASTVYGGTLDATSGELVVDKAYTTLQNYQIWGGLYNTNNINRLVSSGYLNGAIAIICDTLKAFQTQSVISDKTLNSISITTDGRFVITPSFIQGVTTADEAKEILMAANPIHLVYALATPITYNLTPTEVKSLLGINNIWSDAGDVDVEYRADTKLYIKRLTDSDTDMIADSNIVSGQYFMVGNDLYRATVNIASGAQIVVGTNATKVSLSEALNEINA